MKMKKRGLGFTFGRFSAKGNVCQREGNNYQSKSNLSHNLRLPESSKIHDLFLLNQYAKNNDNIPNTISVVNTNILGDWPNPGNTGETIATPNQNTEKLINQSATTDNNAESNLPIYNNSIISTSGFQYLML